MVVKYIVSRFTRQAPYPTAVAAAAAKRAGNNAGLNPTSGLGARISSARLNGTAPPVNMARPGRGILGGGSASSGTAAKPPAPNAAASTTSPLGATQATRQHITASAAAVPTPSASSVGVGKGPKVIVDFSQPARKHVSPHST